MAVEKMRKGNIKIERTGMGNEERKLMLQKNLTL